jgi:histidine phosphotransferase ChpT
MTDASDSPKLTPSGLAALLSARICHDLVSPVSALGTALEVLDDPENPDMHEDALDLVKLSARQASAKLQYLRLAFGAGGSAPGVIGMEQVKKLADGLYADGKVEVSFGGEVNELSKDHVRVLLNLLMMAVQAVPRGGSVSVVPENTPTGVSLSLTANGPKARLAEDVSRPLAGAMPEGGFDGRSIQPFYTGLIARELKGTIHSRAEGETVSFKAELPL